MAGSTDSTPALGERQGYGGAGGGGAQACDQSFTIGCKLWHPQTLHLSPTPLAARSDHPHNSLHTSLPPIAYAPAPCEARWWR